MKCSYCVGAVVMLAGALNAQSMHGTVTDAVTGKPIRGAAVSLAEISRTFTTDSVGRYSTDSVGAGTFTVKITATRYLSLAKKLIVAPPKGAGISDLEFNAGLYNISSVADTSKGQMSITYQFPVHGDVEIAIQNAKGKTIRKMYDRSRAGGKRKVSWNGKDDNGDNMPAGRFTCKVTCGRLVMIRTLVWKGAPEAQPEKVAPPPVAAPEVSSQGAETAPTVPLQPAEPPALPAHDKVTSEEAPEDSAE